MKQGQMVTYRGPLSVYQGKAAEVFIIWTRGLCKGRYQIRFADPVFDIDGVELADELTVAAADIEAI